MFFIKDELKEFPIGYSIKNLCFTFLSNILVCSVDSSINMKSNFNEVGTYNTVM